jgi:hypothetical protein
MNYVDAGYVVALGGSFLYAVVLVWRRRRFERAVAVAARDATDPAAPAQTQP